ncbi:MAG: hypothetical protein ACJ8LM_08910 [Candidatus Udaeobacter sp.]
MVDFTRWKLKRINWNALTALATIATAYFAFAAISENSAFNRQTAEDSQKDRERQNKVAGNMLGEAMKARETLQQALREMVGEAVRGRESQEKVSTRNFS